MPEAYSAHIRTLGEPHLLGRSEVPKIMKIMTMPEVDEPPGRIRLSMHTDNIGQMIRFFGLLPPQQRVGLLVEGRQFSDPETQAKLEEHPVHQFYLKMRGARMREGTLIFAPRSLGFSEEDVVGLASSPYSPATLKDTLGYNLTFYNAADLVSLIKEGTDQNRFLSHFSGANQLRLGSDSLTQATLDKIATDMQDYIRENNPNRALIISRGLEKLHMLVDSRLREASDLDDMDNQH